MSETKKFAALSVVMLIVLSIWFAYVIVQSNECAAVGGAYIVPSNSWPVCVQGVPR